MSQSEKLEKYCGMQTGRQHGVYSREHFIIMSRGHCYAEWVCLDYKTALKLFFFRCSSDDMEFLDEFHHFMPTRQKSLCLAAI